MPLELSCTRRHYTSVESRMLKSLHRTDLLVFTLNSCSLLARVGPMITIFHLVTGYIIFQSDLKYDSDIALNNILINNYRYTKR